MSPLHQGVFVLLLKFNKIQSNKSHILFFSTVITSPLCRTNASFNIIVQRNSFYFNQKLLHLHNCLLSFVKSYLQTFPYSYNFKTRKCSRCLFMFFFTVEWILMLLNLCFMSKKVDVPYKLYYHKQKENGYCSPPISKEQ